MIEPSLDKVAFEYRLWGTTVFLDIFGLALLGLNVLFFGLSESSWD